MAETALEVVLRHDRRIVATAIAIVTALAWAYIGWLATDMSMPAMSPADMAGMDMAGMNMGSMSADMLTPALKPWSATQFLLTLTMWVVMMIGMMTPSATPMLLLYARVGRQARQQGRPFAATSWFTAGYLGAWMLFSLFATALQWALEQLSLLTPMLASASTHFGGGVLLLTGLYQWLAAKDACLVQCQSPLTFLQQQGGFRADARGALRLGLRHGAYCVGCCWALMLLLFVGGVMNVLWIAGLSVLVLLEKIVPTGRLLPRIAGMLLAAAGLSLLTGFP